jgi:hypothetical protein
VALRVLVIIIFFLNKNMLTVEVSLITHNTPKYVPLSCRYESCIFKETALEGDDWCQPC